MATERTGSVAVGSDVGSTGERGSSAPVPGSRRGGAGHCTWCGRQLPEDTKIGRRRRYCGQPCRQRAYERRTATQRGGLPEDAVVLSTAELADLRDRLFRLRCAAEDIRTAVDDGAQRHELAELAAELTRIARDAERLRCPG